jgi:hypothetical protein
MTSIKFNRVAKLSTTARFPRTFRARLANIDAAIIDQLTSKQIAAIIDGPMQRSYSAGHDTGYKDAQ